MKRLAILVAVLVMALLGGGPVAQADEASPFVWEIAFRCDAHYVEWPSGPGNVASCDGDAIGAGTHGAAPFVATPFGNFHADFAHSEVCPMYGEPPLAAQASWTAEIGTTAGLLVAPFSLVRLGAHGVIVVAGSSLGHSHTGAGWGLASFTPILILPIPACGSPGPFTEVVAGQIIFEGV